MITYHDKYDSEYIEYIHVHENLSPNTDDVTRCLPYHSNVRHAPMSQFYMVSMCAEMFASLQAYRGLDFASTD